MVKPSLFNNDRGPSLVDSCLREIVDNSFKKDVEKIGKG